MPGQGTKDRRIRRTRLRRLSVVLLAALPVAGAALVFMAPAAPDPHAGIPEYATHNPRVAEAYHYAVSSDASALSWMACYCGCGGHTGHTSNLACFVKGDGSGFDPHAASCEVCVDIALTAKSMHASGASLSEIRATIDARYPGYPATQTPLPP